MLEQREGAWKGVVISDGRMAKPGYFPPDTVVLLDSSGESLVISTTNQAYKVVSQSYCSKQGEIYFIYRY